MFLTLRSLTGTCMLTRMIAMIDQNSVGERFIRCDFWAHFPWWCLPTNLGRSKVQFSQSARCCKNFVTRPGLSWNQFVMFPGSESIFRKWEVKLDGIARVGGEVVSISSQGQDSNIAANRRCPKTTKVAGDWSLWWAPLKCSNSAVWSKFALHRVELWSLVGPQINVIKTYFLIFLLKK